MTITFVGHGYVGLVTACVFADFGNDVWVIGHTDEKLKRLKSGDPIIYEPGLKELLEKNLRAKRLHFTKNYGDAIPDSEIVFIAVGTPPKENGEADLSAVLAVAKEIGENLKNHFTVVSCKSTVPVGTNLKIEKIINGCKTPAAKVAVASCPEFLREGTAIHDTVNADRVVIGSDSAEAIKLLLKTHEPINGQRVITNLASAELIKYTSNAMLATKISFANLISFYCERTGADVESVLNAVGLDKRIGRIFMDPGVGYGGSCFPKDVNALLNTGKSLGIDTAFLEAVENVNAQSRHNFVDKISAHIPEKNIAVWGLSFKPNTDDIRFAPSIYVINNLLKKNFRIAVYDPVAMDNIRKIFGEKICYCNNPYEALTGVAGLAVLTEWNEFKEPDFAKMKKLMKNHYIFDGRNIYFNNIKDNNNFAYFPIGKKPII